VARALTSADQWPAEIAATMTRSPSETPMVAPERAADVIADRRVFVMQELGFRPRPATTVPIQRAD